MKKIVCLLLGFCLHSCASEDSAFMTIYIDADTDETIMIDGKYAKLSEIPYAYYHKTKDLDSLQVETFYVKLKIEEGSTMEMVSDVKHELRKLNILNLKYYQEEYKMSLSR